MIAKQVIVNGKVQGVYFRASTREQAVKLGITGWVKNLISGEVEIHLEGRQDAIDQLIRWANVGPPHAYVQKVTIYETTIKGFDSFTINR